jgi:succinate dehydrogenase / fumarate reductase membrane anchor subunit
MGTGLGAVRGLGSAKHGAEHWMRQRTTAVANFGLMIWLLASLLRLPSYSYETMTSWLSSPLAAVPLILLIISVFWHFRMGLQVLVEDYVHDDGLKFGCLMALDFYTIGTGAFALFAILKLALTGAPL